MKEKITAFDSKEIFNIVVAFRSQGYKIHNFDENGVVVKKILPKGQFDEDGDNGIFVHINKATKRAIKNGFLYLYGLKEGTDFKAYNKLFTKEELRILDLHDYTLSKDHTKDNGQTIEDWIFM